MSVQSPSIDENEREYFTSRSTDWWNLNGVDPAHHKCGHFIFEYIQNAFVSCEWARKDSDTFTLLKDLLVLDVGCGGGKLAEPLTRLGCTVLGIDVNESLINVAIEHKQLDPTLTKLTYKLESTEDHALSNAGKYDVVVLNFVLPHVVNHDILLSSCIKTLKPGGLIILSGASKSFSMWFKIIFLAEWIFRYIPRGGHNWNHFIKSEDVKRILEQNNCVVKDVSGMSHNPITRTANKVNSTSGPYVMFAIKN